MKELLRIDEIRSIELSILDHIDVVCKKNSIRYYLFYGSLLGAIRHKGFIPWDDDIDIVMPRPDYDKFVQLYKSDDSFELKKPGDNDYTYEFAKVFDKHTIVEEDVTGESDYGIWVDIFPLDGLSKLDKIQNLRLFFLQRSRVASIYSKPPRSSLLFKPFIYVYWRICKWIGCPYFIRKIDKLSRKYLYGDTNYVGFAPSIHSKNKYLDIDWFNDSIDIPFENKEYVAPKEWDACLTSLYGDYMVLPSEDKRQPHNVRAYRRNENL